MHCKNCNSELSELSTYCDQCGGRVIKNRLTLKSLFLHLSETFFNYDNKLLRTFLNLFKAPEDVIGGYISGVRKKYVDVISYFALALTITGFEWFILNKFYPEAIDMSALTPAGSEAVAAANRNVQFVQEYASIVMMFFVPIYALMSRIVFFNIKKYNYTEHLVIFMYVLAQISIVGAVINIVGVISGFPLGKVTFINIPFQIIYSAYCLKRLYKLSFKGIILRTLFFLLILMLFVIVFSIAFTIVNIMIYGSFREYIEAQKALLESSNSG